jgi:HNH endonuclease
MRAPIQTTGEQIVAYWEEAGPTELDMGCDWADALNHCWRCGLKGSLDRCHIVPAQPPFNGPDAPSNLVLLCERCHKEAPNCDDPSTMWEWIKKTRSTYAGSIWAERLEDALEKDLGRPTEEIFRGVDLESFKELYPRIRDMRTGLHPGDSTSTSVWTIKAALAAVAEQEAAVIEIVRSMRDAGMTMGTIAQTLKNVGIKLPGGAK